MVEIAVLLKLCRIRGYQRLLDAEGVMSNCDQDVLVTNVGSKVAWTSGWPTFTTAPPQQIEPDRSASRSKHQAPDASGRVDIDRSLQLEYGVNQPINSSDSTLCESMPTEKKPCGKITASFPLTSTTLNEKLRKGAVIGQSCPKLVQPVWLDSSAEVDRPTNTQYRGRSGTGELLTVTLGRVRHEVTALESRRKTSLPLESNDSLEPETAIANALSQPNCHILTPFGESDTNHFTLPFVFGSNNEKFKKETLPARDELNKPSLHSESSRSARFLPPRPRRNKQHIHAAARPMIPNLNSNLESVSSSYPPQMLSSKPTIPLEPSRISASFPSEIETQTIIHSRGGFLKPSLPAELGSHDPMFPVQSLQTPTQVERKSIRRIWSISRPSFPPIQETSDQTISLDPERVLALKLGTEACDLTPFPGKENHYPIRTSGKETVASTKPPSQETGDPAPPPGPENHDPTSPLNSGFHYTIPPPDQERRNQTLPVDIVALDTTSPSGKDTDKPTPFSGTEIPDSIPPPVQDNRDLTFPTGQDTIDPISPLGLETNKPTHSSGLVTPPPKQDIRDPTSPESQYVTYPTPPPDQETRHPTLLAGQDTLDPTSPPGPEMDKSTTYLGQLSGFLTPPPGQDTRDPTSPEGQNIRDQTPYPGQDTRDQTPYTGQETRDSTPPLSKGTRDPTPTPGQETRDPTVTEGQDICDLTPYPGQVIRNPTPHLGQRTCDLTTPPGQEVRDSSHPQGPGNRDSTVLPCVETGNQMTLSLKGEATAAPSGEKVKPVSEESSSSVSTGPSNVSVEKRDHS